MCLSVPPVPCALPLAPTQVASMVNKATERSLVVVDEFGKGTLTSDGVGLLSASLQHFCQMPLPPRVLASTHFHELLSPHVLPRQAASVPCACPGCNFGGAVGRQVD